MDAFPSLRITADKLIPEGSFAESQAAYLEPDREYVAKLDAILREKKIGIIAHYYMDPELQGVLAACSWEHIGVSDSLLMADRGIAMAEAGCESIVVLGVDFMSENARAILDAAGHKATPVYRVAEKEIGCSLAESAEAHAYGGFLREGAKNKNPLHIVYINTSLVTKAKSHAIIPTITCTSSNVVQTVLQAAAQIEDVSIYFGPDTYMGENLASMLESLALMSDEEIAAVHPDHNQASIESLRQRFHYFEQGNCVVHHLFGADVVARVEESYKDAFVAAHLEVPGEMFALGLERKKKDAGVVGSTSDILAFILRKTEQSIAAESNAAQSNAAESNAAVSKTNIQFILGTEAGMITPIVWKVQELLRQANAQSSPETQLSVDIVFPVASEAVAATGDAALPIVPGVAGGEGCTTAGGCATCPYMKMNSLDALMQVCEGVGDRVALAGYEPRKYMETIAGKTAAELGGEPILHMRALQHSGKIGPELETDIRARSGR